MRLKVQFRDGKLDSRERKDKAPVCFGRGMGEVERGVEKMEMENSKRREGKGKRSEVFLDGESEQMEIVWKR